jgi:hypothetical protein
MDTGVVVGGAHLATVTIDGVSQIRNNPGSGGIQIGVMGATALGHVILDGNGAQPVDVGTNGPYGIEIDPGGSLTATNANIWGNFYDGVSVNTDQAVSLTGCTIRGNGFGMQPLLGSGIIVLRADLNSGPGLVVQQSQIANNARMGIDLGESNQLGLIDAAISDTTISGNGVGGVFASQADAVTNTTHLRMTDNDVWGNKMPGVFLAPIDLKAFTGNTIHNNTGDQLVFYGPGAFDISSDTCGAGATRPANAVYSYTCKTLPVVGISVRNGAIVNASGTSWAASPPVAGVDYTVDSNPASAITVSGECTPIPACPQ